MVTKEKKTVQLGLRIDLDLVKNIEKMADYENIDKMSWIRGALVSFLKKEEQGAKDDAIKNYINLRIDKEKIKKICEFKIIPKDIENARKEFLNGIKNKAGKK